MYSPHQKLKWGPLDLLVIAAVGLLFFYVYYRIDTVLIYSWDWSVIPSYFFRWDDESGKYLPNLLVKGLITTIPSHLGFVHFVNSRRFLRCCEDKCASFTKNDWLGLC